MDIYIYKTFSIHVMKIDVLAIADRNADVDNVLARYSVFPHQLEKLQVIAVMMIRYENSLDVDKCYP